MKYQLAQLNISCFKLPQAHSKNADFINNLDRINAIAETQAGFVWRFMADDNNATDVQAFDDANIIINISVWDDLEALKTFVYNNEDHKMIMRRRNEWFHKVDFTLVLWWVPTGHTPSVEQAKQRLTKLQKDGPSSQAFTFKDDYPAPLR
tara:strand:+ start:656 stop:1105 length:450 start_codon:yes stop_codon:yes gene_type:complete